MTDESVQKWIQLFFLKKRCDLAKYNCSTWAMGH